MTSVSGEAMYILLGGLLEVIEFSQVTISKLMIRKKQLEQLNKLGLAIQKALNNSSNTLLVISYVIRLCVVSCTFH